MAHAIQSIKVELSLNNNENNNGQNSVTLPHFWLCFLIDTYAKLFTRKYMRRYHVSLICTIPFRYCLRTKFRWSSPLSSRSESGFSPDSFSHVYSDLLQVIMVFVVLYVCERILSWASRKYQAQRICPREWSTPTSLASVELFVLIFCFHE
jgi:hypothetical protein